jgi:predicted PurR-regulated permease PerM
MMKRYPFYMRSTVIMFGLVLLVYILFNLREILVPLAFALLLAILLNPLVLIFEKWGLSKIFAIAIAIILSMVVIAGLAYFLVVEVRGFSSDLPAFKDKFSALLTNLQHHVRSDIGINTKKQNEYLNQAESGLKPFLASAMGTVFGTMELLILLPVYAFLFLFYKNLILNFLYEVFADAEEKEVSTVLTQTKGAIQGYMIGLLIEACIVGTLNSVALLILGVKYAILLGVLGALLNVLPFIGGIIAVLLPVLMATVTKDGFQTQLWVIVAYMIIQFTDNHFIVPYIVASRVKINALISIIIVLLGGALWGISGMFLSIPFIGVLKIIFDRLPEMKAWGMLLGMEIPTRRKKRVQRKSTVNA